MSEQLAQRVALLEAEVAQLKAAFKSSIPSDPLPWWEEIAGAFANESIYDEAMQLGREYRESLRQDFEERETVIHKHKALSALNYPLLERPASASSVDTSSQSKI